MEADDLLGWTLMGTTNGEKMIPKCSNHPLSPFMQLLTAPSITLWHLAWKTVDVVAGALSWTMSGSVVQPEQLECSNLAGLSDVHPLVSLRKKYSYHCIVIVMNYWRRLSIIFLSRVKISCLHFCSVVILPLRRHGRSDIPGFYFYNTMLPKPLDLFSWKYINVSLDMAAVLTPLRWQSLTSTFTTSSKRMVRP